jgi:hypothetical protein
MISTISKRAGRRYPAFGAMLRALWLPSVGTTVAPPTVGATPGERSAFIPADDRSARVLTEVRSAFIPADDRTAQVRP